MEVNERIAGHRTSVFSEANFSQIYPAMRPKIQTPNSKSQGNSKSQYSNECFLAVYYGNLSVCLELGICRLGFPLAGSFGRHGTPGLTFLLFSQNRNCIRRVALLRERVPRSALALQRGARAQVYPE